MPSSLRQVTETLFEERYGRPLSEWVAERRAEEKSWRSVSFELREMTGGLIDLPPQTLINWHEGAVA